MNNKINFIIPLKEKPKENNIYFLIKLPQSKPSVLEDDLKKDLEEEEEKEESKKIFEEEKEAKRILEDNLKKELNHFPNLNPI